MADVKITQLPQASLPLTGTEVFPIVQNGVTVQAPVSSGTTTATNIAALQALTVTNGSFVDVGGYYTNGDGGGGTFIGVSGAAAGTYVDNGGTIIVPTGGDGSSAWLRQYSGAINVKWFGAKGDNVTDDTDSLKKAFIVGTRNDIYIPAGNYKYSSILSVIESNVYGSPTAVTAFNYTGAGSAFYYFCTRAATFRDLAFNSLSGSDQDGPIVVGNYLSLDGLQTSNFLGVSLRLGTGSNSSVVPLRVGQFALTNCDNVAQSNVILVGSTSLTPSIWGITVPADGTAPTNGSRVLVANQTNPSQNGIYIVNTSGPWVRASDASSWANIIGASVYVINGNINYGQSYWICRNATGGTIDTTPQYWAKVSRVGSYYCKLDTINIGYSATANTGNALRGIFSDGGFPSTNANTFRQATVAGRFDVMFEVNGTNTSVYAGDYDFVGTTAATRLVPGATYTITTVGTTDFTLVGAASNTVGTVFVATGTTTGTGTATWNGSAMIKIGGTNVRFHEHYCELSFPNYYVWFTSASFSCAVLNPHIQNITASMPNAYSKILDEGWANNVYFTPVGFNFPFPASNETSLNLIPNSAFKSWGTDVYGAVVPTNWTQNGSTTPAWSQDTTTTRGAYASATVTLAAQTTSISCFVASANANNNSANQVKIEDFIGKTIVAAVWCKATAAIGNLKIFGGGAQYGANAYTGSGNWELLTAICKVEPAATDLSITFRQNSANTAATGQMWFSEPILLAGIELRQPERRALTDDNANMYGMLSYAPATVFTDGATSPSVALGNVFNFTNTGATSVTSFVGGKPGQMILLMATNANTTLVNSASTTAANVIKTRTGANITLTANIVYAFVLMKGASSANQWYQVYG